MDRYLPVAFHTLRRPALSPDLLARRRYSSLEVSSSAPFEPYYVVDSKLIDENRCLTPQDLAVRWEQRDKRLFSISQRGEGCHRCQLQVYVQEGPTLPHRDRELQKFLTVRYTSIPERCHRLKNLYGDRPSCWCGNAPFCCTRTPDDGPARN